MKMIQIFKRWIVYQLKTAIDIQIYISCVLRQLTKFKMKKYEEKPIPLIVRSEGKKYEVNPEAVQFFSSIQGKIAIVSVAGIYRTGKSFLMNTILLNQKNGFAVGPTTNPKTKGIWVWGKPLILKNEKDEIVNVCVLDSQGLGSIEEDINHDLRLFSVTLLLSSTFLYNTLGAIDENAIDSFGLVLKLCDHLKAENYNDFPDFYWVLRDFSLALVGKDNNPLTAKMYLQNCLAAQPGDSQVRNKIRQSIRSSFINRNCITFVRPLTDESCLQNLDKMELDQLRPEFVEQVIQFRKTVFSNIKTKKIKGKQINSEMLNQLISIYVAQINGQNLPVIETGWKYVCKRQCENVLDFIQKDAEDAIGKLNDNIPTNKKELSEEKQRILEHYRKVFDSRTLNNDQAQYYLPLFNEFMDKKFKKIQQDMKIKNSQETKMFIKKQFEYIEKKLKQNQFKGMSDLVKQFECFYEYYRKKCPFKDQIQTGLQFLMKKFSDCSIILFKGVKSKKDNQLAKAKQQLQKLLSEISSKQQRHKQQKLQYNDKNAKLQSKIEQLMKQNKELGDNLLMLESDYEKLKNQSQDNKSIQNQQMQFELITLRKKLMQAEDLVKQIECEKMMEINNYKNMIMLKENEVHHHQQQKNNIFNKLTSTINQLTLQKDQKQKKMEDLIRDLEGLKTQNENLKRTSEQKLKQKNNLILQMQNCVESKSAELSNANQQNQKTLNTLLSRFQHQKTQIVESYKQEIQSLKDIIQSSENDNSLKMKKWEAQYIQKQMDLKMHRMEIDKQQAILTQKIDFLKRQCEDKQQRISKLLQENNCYLNIFDEKQNQLSGLSSILQQMRSNHDSTSTQLATKVEQLTVNLSQKTKEIHRLQSIQEKYCNEIRQKNQEIKLMNDRLKNVLKTWQEKVKDLNQKLSYEIETNQKNKSSYEAEIECLRNENSKSMEQQKKNAELSLVQLKNYYQMEKERLEKRILEQRKKHEYNQSAALVEMENKYRKIQKSLNEQISNLKSTIQDLEDKLMRMESDCELKIANSEEERETQRKNISNRYEILQKKYEELNEEYAQFEKSHDQERIVFVKKIEALHFEVSRKQKELSQIMSKKQTLETSLNKKESQIENIKKLMNQEIEGSLKKVSDIQAKYQKLNEDYMQIKIDSEKQIALAKQRNEFLTNKLNELTKEKETGSSKNIEKMDKLKIAELKEQNQKYKTQIMSMQAKLQTMRKNNKDSQTNFKKVIMNLEKENQFLTQRSNINDSKLNDLEIKMNQKKESFVKDLEEERGKSQLERDHLTKEIESLRQSLSMAEDLKNQLTWKLQKQVALLKDRVEHAQYQRDQAKKELQQSEKRLQMASTQLKKNSQKANQEGEARKNAVDKKHINQLQNLKETLKIRSEQYEQLGRKQRQQIKQLKQKLGQMSEKLHRAEKIKNIEKSLIEENQALKKQKQNLINSYRNQRSRQNQEWKRKLNEIDRKNKEIDKQNQTFSFTLQKQQSKWNMQRINYMDKIKSLEDALEWQKNRQNQMNKSKLELKKSQSSSHFNSQYTKYNAWK